jgi:hypothetical protein
MSNTWCWLNETEHVVRSDEYMVCPYYLLWWRNKIKKFHCRIHKSQSLGPVMSQMKPVCIPSSNSCKIHFNSTFYLHIDPSCGGLPWRFSSTLFNSFLYKILRRQSHTCSWSRRKWGGGDDCIEFTEHTAFTLTQMQHTFCYQLLRDVGMDGNIWCCSRLIFNTAAVTLALICTSRIALTQQELQNRCKITPFLCNNLPIIICYFCSLLLCSTRHTILLSRWQSWFLNRLLSGSVLLYTSKHTTSLLCWFLDPEDGGDMFLRNVG